MFIEQYFSEPQGRVCFTREQASDFAKRVADDFNPLHDVDAKRFCVPGDLLFAVILSKYGISRHMQFVFSGMVVDGVELRHHLEAFLVLGKRGRPRLSDADLALPEHASARHERNRTHPAECAVAETRAAQCAAQCEQAVRANTTSGSASAGAADSRHHNRRALRASAWVCLLVGESDTFFSTETF